MLNSGISNIKVFACNSNKTLANAIADKLGLKLGDCEVEKFSDGEISVKINETIRGADVFIIQSTSYHVNDNLMELLIMIDAMKRASAARITAVMPYYGYARQDRKARARDPISAKLVANILTSAGASRVLTMDLHCAQIQGFFDIPVDNLVGSPLLTDFYIKKFGDSLERDFVAVSPDLGSVTRVSNSNPSPMSRQNICFFVLPMASRKAISLRRLRVRNQKVPISPRNTFTNRNTTTTVCVFTLSTSPFITSN